MSLTPGTRIGPYEIQSPLGEGGMGIVFRAVDTKLQRNVALKLLPDHLAGDAERLARFQREAQLLATLNHPNVAQIYGLEGDAAQPCIVMELVDGETLADRLKRGPVAVDETLQIAKEIAEGVEAAHEKGIIHRDLKPANIKLTAAGKAKVLDFGLAKAFQDQQAASLSHSPTLMSASMPGVILGTAAYMSPEQAKGKEADRTADVWAFGCILYEMLTGTPVSTGQTISEIFAATLRDEPDWKRLPQATPPGIQRLLRKCLRKDPRQRIQSMGDLRIEITDAQIEPVSDVTAVANSAATRTSRYAWLVAGLFALALIYVGYIAWTALRKEPEASLVRFEIAAPPGRSLISNPSPRFSVSPDGRYVVFSVSQGNGQPEQLWLRRLDSLEARPIPGTESVARDLSPQQPFWSPDSKHIGFFTQNALGADAAGTSKLKRVDVEGGTVQTLCDLPSNQAWGTWNSDGVILVSTQTTGGIMRVSANGGQPVQVTTVDKSQESAHLWPYFLPDGRHFLYQARPATKETWVIYLTSLDSMDRKLVVQSESMAQFVAPDFLLFARGEALMAQRMNMSTYELIGEPTLIVKTISRNDNGRAGFSVSNTGVLVYSSAEGNAYRQIRSTDRTGRTVDTGPVLNATGIRVARDGKQVAFALGAFGERDLWLYDVERDLRMKLTSEAASDDDFPVWSPDGKRLVFRSRKNDQSEIEELPANSATAAQTLLPPEPGMDVVPLDWSADGRYLLFRKNKGYRIVGPADLWVLPLFGDRKPFPYLVSPATKGLARFSPNGKWVVYVSFESGIQQVFVQPFPESAGGKWQVSPEGGTVPHWGKDGRELYFLDLAGRVIAVPVIGGGEFILGKAVVLFEPFLTPFPSRPDGALNPFSVTDDGERFFILGQATGAQSAPLTVVLNWTAALTNQRTTSR